MNIDQALQTFIEESSELLQQLESTLLSLETECDDPETINELFRAAHTIKGSAGMFGFDAVVDFTHGVEGVLDRLRNQLLSADDELISLLLRCTDHIALLVDSATGDGVEPDAQTRASGQSLQLSLSGYLGTPVTDEPAEPSVSALTEPLTEPVARLSEDDSTASDCWHLSLRFGEAVLQNGMDPASFIRYLGQQGGIVRIVTLHDRIPVAEEMDPENCYLGFEIALRSDAERREILDVFEFVQDDCEIHLMPPHCKVDDYIDLIASLPEDNMRIGEILVASDALTKPELERVLAHQQAQTERVDHGNPETAPVGEMLVESGRVQQPVVDAALAKQRRVEEKTVQGRKFIKVPAEKLDQLINLVGELVIAGAGSHMLAQQTGHAALIEATSTVAGLVEDIRDNSLQLRMVQIGETFSRFRRVVRDVSGELGKTISLTIDGADTELDKSVVEKIADPLMHMVRNAIDHGIETAELRCRRGKPEAGSLTLSACHDSGSIVIDVSDDGGGLDAGKIHRKAVERGLISADAQLSDKEIFRLVMEPGFSTAETVSNLSGRGVGMDVARRNIEALRGTVELDSRLGEGTRVRIRLPLTLAIIDGFLIRSGSCAYVVPLDMMIECVELTRKERLSSHNSSYISLRGEILPFLRLRDIFDLDSSGSDRENIVVVQYGGCRAGFLVDELLGEFQTVIKPLGPLFGHLQGISGSTILGSGEVAMILDVPALIQRAVNREQYRHQFNSLPMPVAEAAGAC